MTRNIVFCSGVSMQYILLNLFFLVFVRRGHGFPDVALLTNPPYFRSDFNSYHSLNLEDDQTLNVLSAVVRQGSLPVLWYRLVHHQRPYPVFLSRSLEFMRAFLEILATSLPNGRPPLSVSEMMGLEKSLSHEMRKFMHDVCRNSRVVTRSKFSLSSMTLSSWLEEVKTKIADMALFSAYENLLASFLSGQVRDPGTAALAVPGTSSRRISHTRRSSNSWSSRLDSLGSCIPIRSCLSSVGVVSSAPPCKAPETRAEMIQELKNLLSYTQENYPWSDRRMEVGGNIFIYNFNNWDNFGKTVEDLHLIGVPTSDIVDRYRDYLRTIAKEIPAHRELQSSLEFVAEALDFLGQRLAGRGDSWLFLGEPGQHEPDEFARESLPPVPADLVAWAVKLRRLGEGYYRDMRGTLDVQGRQRLWQSWHQLVLSLRPLSEAARSLRSADGDVETSELRARALMCVGVSSLSLLLLSIMAPSAQGSPFEFPILSPFGDWVSRVVAENGAEESWLKAVRREGVWMRRCNAVLEEDADTDVEEGGETMREETWDIPL